VNPTRAIDTHPALTFFALIATLLLLAWGASAFAADAQTAGAKGGAAQSSGARTAQQIAADIQKAGQDLGPLFATPQDLFEPAKRQAAAPKAVPALRKMIKLLDELIATRPAGAPQGQEKIQLMALLSALGDNDAAGRLQSMASSAVAGECAAGRSAQLFAAWLLTDANPAAQQKVIDDLAALAKRYPDEPAVAGAAIMLAGTTAPQATELRDKVAAAVNGTLKGNAAATATKQIQQINLKFEAQAKLKALEGKPMVLEGATPAGGTFSTAEFKGKVVLVDFWATWCVPCKQELPKIKKLYAKYHTQGLEVVGVSCDNEGEELVKFLSQNKDVPWPQLFDAGQPGWHKLADQYGINSIPAIFVIDRKGVLRSVDARETYEKLVPELLKEQP
jgi:thiol-disulfide isomerase/thioredoxin